MKRASSPLSPGGCQTLHSAHSDCDNARSSHQDVGKVMIKCTSVLMPQRRARRKKTRSRKSRGQTNVSPTENRTLEACEETRQNKLQTALSSKLFVGQLPIDVNEQHLRAIFEQFGKISQLKLCRDKITGRSARCCFVTFEQPESATAACKALHNVTIFPQMLKPLQVKFADHCANYRQRKIFIGMIPKTLNEADLMAMFSVYGDIEECTVTRESNGFSKGSAFITYVDKKSASAAIDNMHQSRVMAGCRSPVVVKLADSKAVKVLKQLDRELRMSAALPRPDSNTAAIVPLICTTRSNAAVGCQLQTNSWPSVSPNSSTVVSTFPLAAWSSSYVGNSTVGGFTAASNVLHMPSGFVMLSPADCRPASTMTSLCYQTCPQSGYLERSDWLIS